MRTGHRDPRSSKSYQHVIGDEGRNQQCELMLGNRAEVEQLVGDCKNGKKNEDETKHGGAAVMNSASGLRTVVVKQDGNDGRCGSASGTHVGDGSGGWRSGPAGAVVEMGNIG